MCAILVEVEALEDYLAHIAFNNITENDTSKIFRGVLPKLVKVGQVPYHNDTQIKFRGVLPKLVKVGQVPYHVFAFQLSKNSNLYKAFCSGSIIGADKVLSSANCYLTTRKSVKCVRVLVTVFHKLRLFQTIMSVYREQHQTFCRDSVVYHVLEDPLKRYKVNIDEVQLVAGIVTIRAIKPGTHEAQQWRHISIIYSQRFFRFPAYDLAILKTQIPFIFNKWVNMIPYASLNQNFDGICVETTLKARSSWASSIVLALDTVQMLTMSQCEHTFLRSCRLFYATAFKNTKVYLQTEGSGLVCYETNDPMEKGDGVLVGVTSLLNVAFPTMHTKVGLFNKWITNSGYMTAAKFTVLLFLVMVNKLL